MYKYTPTFFCDALSDPCAKCVANELLCTKPCISRGMPGNEDR